MKIDYHKTFLKQYKKLGARDRKSVDEAIETFTKNPFTKSLENHPLFGNLVGKRSITAGYDLRILFEEENGYTMVYLLQVGSHNQLYG